MSREVPQNLDRFNFFQMIPGSRRLSATVADSYRFVFPYKFSRCWRSTLAVAGSRRQSQAVAGSRRLSYDNMETRLNPQCFSTESRNSNISFVYVIRRFKYFLKPFDILLTVRC